MKTEKAFDMREVDLEGYIDRYREKFIAANGREPKYLPTGQVTRDGKLMWAHSEYVRYSV